MTHDRATRTSRPLRWASSFPAPVRVGLAIIAAGLLLDLSLLALMPAHPVAGPEVGGHGGHVLVLIGMVLILLGVITDGARASGRHSRPEGSSRNAIR